MQITCEIFPDRENAWNGAVIPYFSIAKEDSSMADANETVHTNVKFKDRLFRIVFGAEENKKHLISLYNAQHQSGA